MALPTAMVSTTLDWIRDEAPNDWYTADPGVEQLINSGKKKNSLLSGGDKLKVPLVFDDEGNFQWYTGNDLFVQTLKETITHFEAEWKWAGCDIVIADTDVLKNSGPQAIINLLQAKKDNGLLTLRNNVATAFHGTAAGKSMLGLGDVYSTTTTFGGLAVADYAGWVARIDAASTQLTYELIHKFWLTISETGKKEDVPTLILSNAAVYGKMGSIMQAQQRYALGDPTKFGFTAQETLLVDSIPWTVSTYVPGSGDGVADNHVRFINSNHLGIFVHRDRNFIVKAAVEPTNQDVQIIKVRTGLQLWCSRRRRQGELTVVNSAL